MKRLHVSFGVKDLEKSVLFYSTLFGAEPSVRRPGYAKWMLDDPRVNFVVESLSGEIGFSHAGIQVESQEELEPIFSRLKEAEAPYLPEGVTTCCYHKSEKSWTADPDGVRWEAFELGGRELSEDRAPTLQFDLEGRFGLFSGCNSFSGQAEIGADAITFPESFAGTLMACPPALEQIEDQFFAALQGVTAYAVAGDSLVLIDASSEPVLKFIRTP